MRVVPSKKDEIIFFQTSRKIEGEDIRGEPLAKAYKKTGERTTDPDDYFHFILEELDHTPEATTADRIRRAVWRAAAMVAEPNSNRLFEVFSSEDPGMIAPNYFHPSAVSNSPKFPDPERNDSYLQEVRPFLARRIAYPDKPNAKGLAHFYLAEVRPTAKSFVWSVEHVSRARKGAVSLRKTVGALANEAKAKAHGLRPNAREREVNGDEVSLLGTPVDGLSQITAPGAAPNRPKALAKQQRPPTKGFVPLPHGAER